MFSYVKDFTEGCDSCCWITLTLGIEMINLVVKESVANQHNIQNESFCPLFM